MQKEKTMRRRKPLGGENHAEGKTMLKGKPQRKNHTRKSIIGLLYLWRGMSRGKNEKG